MPNPSNGLMPEDQFDYDDQFGDETTDDLEDDCGLMHDGQCSMAGTEHCDFSCPNRMSEDFAGSPAWMKAKGSACHVCGAEITDGQEPGFPRPCAKCTSTS